VSAAAERLVTDVRVGEAIDPVAFPLPVYRLVMEAGANRDFNSIHHNTEYARSTGAPEMYANTLFLMGMWERAIRDWMGPAGRFVAVRGFRMGRFNTAGSTTTVHGEVIAVDAQTGMVTLRVRSDDEQGTTVGPGEVDVLLPRS
jgi:acyl dehydratase